MTQSSESSIGDAVRTNAAEPTPLRKLYIVRYVAATSIDAACQEIEEHKPHADIEVHTPTSDRRPGIELLVRPNMKLFPDDPFIDAEEVRASILKGNPGLAKSRPATIEEVTPHESGQGDVFIKLQLTEPDNYQTNLEKKFIKATVVSEAEEVFGQPVEWVDLPLRYITVAKVPGEMPKKISDDMVKVVKYFLGRTIILEPINQPVKQ